jgi:NAD-dependent deacetylase
MSAPLADCKQAIRQAAYLLRNSHRAILFTGAGFSTPSGIPDFRSAASGLWARNDPMQVASLSAFWNHPEKFYAWLRPLASHILNAAPNAAHLSIAHLEQSGFIRTVITQNIDGLHTRAGSKNVLEVHGTMSSLTCIGCQHNFKSNGVIKPYIEKGSIPLCPACGQLLKPDIVLYEEQLPFDVWRRAQQEAETCDLMLVAGTSLEVMPSAGLPARALENEARLVIVNLSPTYLDRRADILITADVVDIIPQIASELLDD